MKTTEQLTAELNAATDALNEARRALATAEQAEQNDVFEDEDEYEDEPEDYDDSDSEHYYHEDSPSLDDHPWTVFRAGERE